MTSEYTRRVLDFPAIRPCETVSFPTLLSSLLNLGHKICGYKSRTLFTNKKNARNLLRLIESLLIFLEEIRNEGSVNGDSLFLSLSELYWVFQKVHFLLEDCTRVDARLFMLVNSEKISDHFRLLMRAIALVMDVMPLAGLDVDFEVKELAELVSTQAQKAKLEWERVDRRFMTKIVLILKKFERGIAPETRDLRRIIEHLGIKSWNECNEEVKFLESEISRECSSTSDERDLGLLCNIEALLIYCRCRLFMDMDSVKCDFRQSNRGFSSGMIQGLNSDDFRCPITLEIMTDPVTISTGQTYDRLSILTWFRSGNRTCPKTGERLMYTDLVPNLALKQLVMQHCSANGIPFSESDAHINHGMAKSSSVAGAGSLASAEAMSLLSKYLAGRLADGTTQEQRKAAYEIRLLTKSSSFNRSCFMEVGEIIPSLLKLLCLGDPAAQENAMSALVNLSKYPKTNQLLMENGGLNLVVDVLNGGLRPEARQHAAGALFYLSSVENNKTKIGRIAGSIPGLMNLLRDGSDRAKKNALLAILVLVMCPENHSRFLESGLIPLLKKLLTDSVMEDEEEDELTTHSLATLSALSKKLDGSMALIHSGTLPIIIQILSSSTSKSAKDYCVSLLLSLCINAGTYTIPLLIKNSSLMMTLYSILTCGTTHSSKKASSLIRILHAFNEKGVDSSMASGVHQQHFVSSR
ncbi:U-box domain-containing protein 19-like [Dorcoceras hygrometricum]|uniref:RING-type E3 ubiquitin transferase n=1 Tax=Dorcoceras hygrometricum TaxID=472368 RepID=A0A2Z7ANX2_9LAMI|nr:U-box domain-containing protein 19-like [Dorcoceras hygrometricum]